MRKSTQQRGKEKEESRSVDRGKQKIPLNLQKKKENKGKPSRGAESRRFFWIKDVGAKEEEGGWGGGELQSKTIRRIKMGPGYGNSTLVTKEGY